MDSLRQLTARVVNLPRLTRILIVIGVTLLVTLTFVPIVDGVYLASFFARDTLLLPAIVLAMIGFVVYVLGWWLLVGFAGETPALRWAVLWYVMVGLAAFTINFILLIRGVIDGLR